MWIAKQRADHSYVGDIPSSVVQTLVAHLRRCGLPAPTTITAETVCVSVSGGNNGLRGLDLRGRHRRNVAVCA